MGGCPKSYLKEKLKWFRRKEGSGMDSSIEYLGIDKRTTVNNWLLWRRREESDLVAESRNCEETRGVTETISGQDVSHSCQNLGGNERQEFVLHRGSRSGDDWPEWW